MGRWMIIKGGFMMWRGLNICLGVIRSGGRAADTTSRLDCCCYVSVLRLWSPGVWSAFSCSWGFCLFTTSHTSLPVLFSLHPSCTTSLPFLLCCYSPRLYTHTPPPPWNHRQSYFLLSCFLPVVECMSGHSHPPLTISAHVHASPSPPLFLSLFLLFYLLVPPCLSVSLPTWDRNASSFSLSSWGGLFFWGKPGEKYCLMGTKSHSRAEWFSDRHLTKWGAFIFMPYNLPVVFFLQCCADTTVTWCNLSILRSSCRILCISPG